MIEESNVFVNNSEVFESFASKKQKNLKVQIPENKRINKSRRTASHNAGFWSKAGVLPPKDKELLKHPKNIEKLRRQLKFEQNPRVEDPMQEETTEGEEEARVEDQPTHQPLANVIEEEQGERRDMPVMGNGSTALAVNEMYARQMLERFNQSEKTFSPQNFLQNQKITPFMRSKMIDWLIEVLTSYKCLDETFFLAVSLMDRFFCQSNSAQNVSELHLIGVTSIFIACKYEEIYPLRLQTVHERIAHCKLSTDQIKAKELEMLEALDFNVTGPTVYDYVTLLIHLIGIKTQVSEEKFIIFEKIVGYITKMVVFEYDIISNKSLSTLAAGVLYIQKVKTLLNLEDQTLIEVATQILCLARNFDKIFQNLANLKKFNVELFNQLQKFQSKNKEEGVAGK